jgi:hypothetical protein
MVGVCCADAILAFEGVGAGVFRLYIGCWGKRKYKWNKSTKYWNPSILGVF